MDGLSRWGVLGQEMRSDSVQPDWESTMGIINDLFVIACLGAAGDKTSHQALELVGSEDKWAKLKELYAKDEDRLALGN